MYRESRHLDRKNSRFCVRSAQNRLFFRRKRVLGETKKHSPRIARVVRLVSLRRLSNFFDSLKNAEAHGFCILQLVEKPAVAIKPEQVFCVQARPKKGKISK